MTRLYDRSVLEVSGDEARGFLHGLVTCPVETLSAGEARFGALLTAQGKVLFDFFLVATPTGILIDCAADQRDALLKRLTLYRLRAKVTLAARDDLAVVAAADLPPETPGLIARFADPRRAGLGVRAIVPVDITPAEDGFDLEARRLTLGVPAGGRDFAFGEVFPADANMDALEGVDFKKGCFVGQEVVARMKHRGTARWRMLLAAADAPLPEPGTPILDGEKSVGTLGTSRDGKGLALVRIDRVAEARRAGRPLAAAGRILALDLPDYATFSWPETTGE